MSRVKKPRAKAYNPSRTVDRIERRVDKREQARPLQDDQMRDLGIAYRIAYDLLRTGLGNEESWSTLACVLDIASALAESGMGAEHLPTIRDALDGMHRAKERAQRTGRWALDGDALNAVRNGLAIHDAQVEAATKGDMRAAMAEVERRINVQFQPQLLEAA